MEKVKMESTYFCWECPECKKPNSTETELREINPENIECSNCYSEFLADYSKQELSRWIPVGERLPYKGAENLPSKLKPVLTWDGNHISTAVYIPEIELMAGGWKLTTHAESLEDSDCYWTDWIGNLPTHWQWLEPPKGK